MLLPQTAESMGFDTSEFDVNDLVTLQSLDSSRRKLLSEISILGKLLLVMAVTNAVSERSFSDLRWLNRVMQDHEARASDLDRKLIFSFFLLFS